MNLELDRNVRYLDPKVPFDSTCEDVLFLQYPFAIIIIS